MSDSDLGMATKLEDGNLYEITEVTISLLSEDSGEVEQLPIMELTRGTEEGNEVFFKSDTDDGSVGESVCSFGREYDGETTPGTNAHFLQGSFLFDSVDDIDFDNVYRGSRKWGCEYA